MNRPPAPLRLLLGCGLVGGGLALPVAAQDVPNPLLTFSLSSTLRASDNYDLSSDPAGNSTFFDNSFGVVYQAATDVQDFRIGLSGVARLADLPVQGSDARFDNPNASLDYSLTGANSEIRLDGRYNRADLAFFDPLSLLEFQDPITGEDLVTTATGYRQTTNLGLGFDTGLAGPLSFSFQARTRDRKFVDVSESDLYDTRNDTLFASAGALISPTTQLSLNGTASRYQADDPQETDRLSRSLSVGLSHELARAMTITGSLGYQLIDTDETDPFGTRGSTRTDGTIGSLGVTQQLTNGSIGLVASHSITTSGGRSALVASRALDLPDGSLSFSLGLSAGDSGDPLVIGDINYVLALASGRISLALTREVQTDNADEDLEVTRARLGLSHDLTPVSGLDLNIDYVSTNAVTGGDDRQYGRLRTSYRHALTEDWDLSGGYAYTVSQREGRGDATENSIFLTVGRQFQIRP